MKRTQVMSIASNRRFRSPSASLAALTALAACGGDTLGSGADATTTTIAPSTSPTPSALVGEQLRWVLDRLGVGGARPRPAARRHSS
jgi:hypothetical protein